jgi:hypothetical protein
VLADKKRFLFFHFLMVSLLLGFFSCQRPDEFPAGKKIITGAEQCNDKGDKFVDENGSDVLFAGGKLQTDVTAHTGKYAVYTTPKKAFAFSYSIRHAGPDWYFKISVWRKSKDEHKGVLVAAAKDSRVLYMATAVPVGQPEDGWQKLEMEVYTPPTFYSDELTFYVWNNGNDTIYFDDMIIERLPKKIYPDYKEEPLSVVLDSSKYLKILKKRKQAFEKGILQSSDNDWVKAIVFGNGEMMKAKIRLKGDWLDHLRGDKWSFRIKLRKNYAWNRLRVFSVQTPLARGFLNEWLSHKFYESDDILTTRYGFIPFMLNNEPRGLYAWEEHFVKQLIESRNRREGPIVKFSEDAFWQILKYSIWLGEEWPEMPYYETAIVKPFKQSKTVGSPTLYKEFLNAQKLAYQYKNHLMPPSAVFDINKLAKYYAMLELTQGRHGMAWHNQRFYFNPVLCKLEPIAYDGFADYTKLKPGIENNYAYIALNSGDTLKNHEYLNYDLFTDTVFIHKYLKYLRKYSDPEFINKNMAEFRGDMLYYDSLLKLEFPEYDFDTARYTEVAADIRSYLPELEQMIKEKLSDTGFRLYSRVYHYTDSTIFENTPAFFVNAYLEKTEDDSVTISIYNYFPADIILLGTGYNNKYVTSYQVPEPELKAYRGDEVSHTEIVTDTGSVYLFFMVRGHMDSFVTEINPWPHPHGLTPQQQLVQNARLEDYADFMKVDGKRLVVPAGDHKVNIPVIIPEGYTLQFEPGAKLDLTDSALLISYSPVEIKGTEDNKVVITSSDFTARGFTVLQAAGRSKIEHAVFENLNTLDIGGWTITGAVTFYESDVTMDHVLFYRNQCEDALNTVRSEFELKNTSFDHIFGDAFDSDFCKGTVDHCWFTAVGNDAIDYSGSYVQITNTEIDGAEDKGVSGGEDSHLVLENVTVRNSNIGLASKDLSTLDVKNSKVIDCNYGIVLLQKKPEYGPAKMKLVNMLIEHAKTPYLIEKGSEVVVDGKSLKGDKEDVAGMFY